MADDKTDPHTGMMGDGTEEQDLGQKGDPGARITADEVEEAFGSPEAPGGTSSGTSADQATKK